MSRFWQKALEILKFVPPVPWLIYCRRRFNIRGRILSTKSWILCVFQSILCVLDCITLHLILPAHLQRYLGRRRWAVWKYHFLDGIIAFWLAIEVASLFQLGQSSGLFVWLRIFLIWRLFDIFQSWFSMGVLHPKPKPYSVARMLTLQLVGFAEAAIIFGVLDFVWKDAFISTLNGSTFCSVWQSLYHSVTTITTIGSVYLPRSMLGYLLVYGEVICGILFLVVLIQRTLSFPRK